MPRSADEMIGELRDRLGSVGRDPGALERASALATRIPLVHRTGRGGQRWPEIFRGGRLVGAEPGTRWERESLGVDRATYFFWGCGAYPHGSVALLLDGVPPEPSVTATPFDTGGCERGHVLRAGCPLSDEERRSALDRFTLNEGERVPEYGAHYVADLFDDPADYVRRPQRSQPDRPPIHELASPNEDRRAWTIEVRAHGDVLVPPERLKKVVLRDREQLRELPRHYRRLAVFSTREDFEQQIVEHVLS